MTKPEPYKTVIVVRKDLELPTGKWIAQAVHAALRVQKTSMFHQEYLNDDEYLPICIVCYVKKESDFEKLKKKCDENYVQYAVQYDAGYNHVPAGTPTCMCIGPAPVSLVDKATKRLQLLK